MNGIVPLYYNMRKAEPTLLNNKNIYAGLNAAFTHGNIGIYSNNISKIWNSDVFVSGTDEEKREAIDVVKLLCMENNFCIDSAKTLYMPTRPEWFTPIVSKFTNQKLPAFFEFAKDKEKKQVAPRNDAFVNKLYKIIPNKTINTTKMDLGKINYKMMMENPSIICSKEVSGIYDVLTKQYRYMINMKDEYIDNLRYIACTIRNEFAKTGYSDETITDMLVEYMYGRDKRRKQLIWFCYGNYIVKNLEKNLFLKKTKFIQCVDCGEWIEVDIKDNRTTRCDSCQIIFRKKYQRDLMRKRKNLA